jgi:hypothetical protein
MTYTQLEQTNKELIDRLIILEEIKKKLQRTLKSKQPIVANFSNVAMPLVEKVFPELVINDIVKVQPMTKPTGLVKSLFEWNYTS